MPPSRARGRPRHVIFALTGRPGVGKTTLVKRLARELWALGPSGFTTEELREGGERVGFLARSLAGKERQILSHVRIRGKYRVGRYGVDVEGFERFLGALDLLGSPAPVVVIDEIGKMECFSMRFVETVERLFDSGKIVVATIAIKGEGLIERVKGRHDCSIFEVTVGNRDRLQGELAARILDAVVGLDAHSSGAG